MEFRDSDGSSKSSNDANIQIQLNSATNSPIHNSQSNLNLISNNNSSSSANSAIINSTHSATQLALRSNEVHTVILYGIPIIALVMEGSERLCLAQISNTLLKNYSYNEIHNRRVALGITCVQCTPVQLELLRRAGAMPVSSRRCGMITKREAERLCKSFLTQTQPPNLPEDYQFDIYHKCSHGCKGYFLPARYNSSRAKCIKCYFCGLFFSPNKFIFHYHQTPNSSFVHPDAANFNSWRRHIKLVEGSSDNIINLWEEVKAMFNGGSRKRAMSATLNSISKQEQHHKQQMTRNLVSNSLAMSGNVRSSSGSTLNSSHLNRGQNSSRKSNHQSAKFRAHKIACNQDMEEDEELIVDDDYTKTSSLPNQSTGINLLNSHLFSASNSMPNNNTENDLNNPQLNNSSKIPLNLLSSVSNCHNVNKNLNQNHSLITFAPFQGNGNSPIPNNCINDLSLISSSNNASLNNRSSNVNNASLANNLNRTTNGQLDVMQAMLPMLGPEFIWPAHHPLNSLTQLSNFNNINNHHSSPNIQTHLNTLVPNQTASSLNNFAGKSPFPFLYNNSPSSLLFTHHDGSPNPSAPFIHTQPNNHKSNSHENWLNNVNADSQSAFKKVNTINKLLLEDNRSVVKKSNTCDDYSVDNLSKGKKLRSSFEIKKLKEDENVDVDGDGGEMLKKLEMNKMNEIKIDKPKEEESNNFIVNLDSYKMSEELKNKLTERLNKRKKTNSLGEDRSSEEMSDCGSANCASPIRSHSACDLINDKSKFKNVSIAELNCGTDNCRLSDCNCKRSSSASQLINNHPDSKLIDLSNVNSSIKNNQEINHIKLTSGKELDLVNNIMAINKLKEVMNVNYSNDDLFKEEIEKRIQLVSVG